ncbi:cellulose biosynthesis cyclic di-GMP-binding regulatory protein BcsB [Azospirillum sp. INR13]|uniref:cellulose biosynthesis cyclic di-GMP-binding regulatory protein BcsB n=1 Tax=Azospirillum sp. INR13 TaxID=2596919 RepID=UPI0018925098|nr:cellulose biosynthesis cyclic di-GMP-binding regulatory protein BcsB [Azospirillum sp. INR13]MBF5094715.1 cellulose biosynthesis cyclic di-GMP-binding regulatory protein BcsB [Azospirillum sp. INR13]
MAVKRHHTGAGRSGWILLALLSLWIGFAAPVLAADKRVIPLSNLRDGQPEVTLHGETETVALRAVLPPVVGLTSVVLALTYENGIDILPEKGSMSVYINGSPVADLPLSAFRGPVNASITLPASLMRPGENQIVFQTNAQHRAICTVRGTYDLWARVNLAASSLTLVSDGGVPQPDLAMMRQLLVAADRAREPLAILHPGSEVDADHLGWGAMVAQSYGLLLGDQTPQVTAVPAQPPSRPAGSGASGPPSLESLPLPGGKNVLIGTRDRIAPLLGEARAAAITGPFLAIYPLPAPGGGAFVAVASGRTQQEVDQAVMRLADISRPLPTQTAMIVTDAAPPAPLPHPPVQAEGRYRLSELGFQTVQHSGYRYAGRFTLTLPTGFAPVSDRSILFHVNGAFEGNLGPGAVLNVRVNGKSAGAIEVDKRSSGVIDNGEMPLPMAMFRPGPNVIEVEAELPPAGGTDCVFAVRRPSFTLLDSSSIEIPGFARLVTLPSLGGFANTAYPYGGLAGGEPAAPFDLVVVGREPAWFGAAWSVTARLAQRAGDLMAVVPYTGWDGAPDDNALIVGPVAALPQAVFASAPLPADRLAGLLEAGALIAQASARGEPMAAADRRALVDRLRLGWSGSAARPGVARPGAVPSPLGFAGTAQAADSGANNRWQRMAGEAKDASSASGSWVPDWARRVMAAAARYVNHWTVENAPVDVVALTENADQLPEAALLQYRAPGTDPLTWTLLTASDPRSIDRAMRSLGEAGLWDRLRGGGALWSSAAPAVTTLEASHPYQIILNPFDIGNLILILARNLSQRIELLFALLLGTAVVLTISMRLLLKHGHRERSGP